VHRAEEQVPGSAGEGLEPDGERRQNVRNVHPALVPSNAPVGRDAPELEVLGVRDRPKSRLPMEVSTTGGGLRLKSRGPRPERLS
jgi:hypothetical protein